MTDGAISVLVVDDNPEFLEAVRAIFGGSAPAAVVHTAETGSQALDVLRTGVRPSLIVLDYHLPDIDAPTVLTRIRASSEWNTLPVLVLSQADWEADRTAVMAAGAQEFRVKPSRMRLLRDVLIDMWRKHGDPS